MNKRKLQSLINASVRAHDAAFDTATALNLFCEEHFGFAPADGDVDTIIDGCMGGSGRSIGMSADEFIAAMEEARHDG